MNPDKPRLPGDTMTELREALARYDEQLESVALSASSYEALRRVGDAARSYERLFSDETLLHKMSEAFADAFRVDVLHIDFHRDSVDAYGDALRAALDVVRDQR